MCFQILGLNSNEMCFVSERPKHKIVKRLTSIPLTIRLFYSHYESDMWTWIIHETIHDPGQQQPGCVK